MEIILIQVMTGIWHHLNLCRSFLFSTSNPELFHMQATLLHMDLTTLSTFWCLCSLFDCNCPSVSVLLFLLYSPPSRCYTDTLWIWDTSKLSSSAKGAHLPPLQLADIIRKQNTALNYRNKLFLRTADLLHPDFFLMDMEPGALGFFTLFPRVL